MEGSGSDPMDLMPAAVGSLWEVPRVRLVYFAQKGSSAGFLGLLYSVNRGTASEVICSPLPNWTTKLVSPLWCEKPAELGDFKSKSKRILASWAGYMKSRGLRNALGCLVTPAGQAALTRAHGRSTHLCSSSCTPGSTTQAGLAPTLGKHYHPLGKAFSSILRDQNLGTFYT